MSRKEASFLNRNHSNSLFIKMNLEFSVLFLLPVVLLFTNNVHPASAQQVKLGAGGVSASLNLGKPKNESLEEFRERCLAAFPEFKQEPMDSELNSTEVPTTPSDLDSEATTTELPSPENSGDPTTNAPNDDDSNPENTTTSPPESDAEPTTPVPPPPTTIPPELDAEPTTPLPPPPTTSPPESDAEPTTPVPPTTTTPSSSTATTTAPLTKSARRGKQLDVPDANLVSDPSPSVSNDALIRLIQELTKKIEKLEATQKALYDNIDELQKKLENTPQIMQQKEATTDLVSGDPTTAAEKWKDLAQDVNSPDELGNITNNIVEDAFDQGAPPTAVMDFVDKLPSPQVQESAYSTVADKLNCSEKVQEELYWKDMTPYCQQAAQSIGPNNPSTIKMYNAQNQIRLNAARPIAQTCRNIQQQEYQPAVFNWLTMVRDIPDSPPQLENNMKRMMLRTYEGNPVNLPFAFHFILLLPQTQGYYKQVAYKCLTQEMKSNGHYYNPNYQQQI